MNTRLRLLLQRIGPRGAFLLAWAWVDTLFGLGILLAPAQIRQNPAYRYPEQIMPLKAWACTWLVVAAVLLVAAFAKRIDWPGFTAGIGVKMMWGMLAFAGWIAGDIPRGYVSTGIWLGAAATVFICGRYLPVGADSASGKA